MAQGSFNRYRGKMPMADMDVVALVDVMLVIFIVTAPLLTHSMKIDLPKASQPEVHIGADHRVYYEMVAEIMALAAKAGLVRIGFVSDPAP